MTTMSLLEAIDRAIEAETKAQSFYDDAAKKTSDPGGSSMFRELSAFEAHHRERLLALRASLGTTGTWIEYEGRDLSKVPPVEAAGRPAVGEHADALEALRLGVAAEEKAEAEYRALAGAAGNELGQKMFQRLADEESRHRKLLDEQYLALANRGIWFWND